MKITKRYLQRIIKEEIANLNEGIHNTDVPDKLIVTVYTNGKTTVEPVAADAGYMEYLGHKEPEQALKAAVQVIHVAKSNPGEH